MITVPALAVVKPIRLATITVRRGTEWETKPVVMTETEALLYAKEFRSRGMVATVTNHG